MVWIDRFKLHANIARFHRTSLNEKKSMPKKAGGVKNDIGVNDVGNSYVHMVKGQMKLLNKESEATPALVLSCLLSNYLSKSLFGRVKKFASLANIWKAVSIEGFANIKIQYMGELRVLLEFVSEDSMKLFQDNVSIGSWFCQLKQASMEFNIEGRIAWVEVEGWVPDFMKENDDEEQNDDGDFNVHESGCCGGDSDVEGILETIFEESRQKETTWMRNIQISRRIIREIHLAYTSCSR
nr:nucleotide-binding alpha-beta plait domain-containing protein [Tanacetum cinerariifolium]